MGTIVLARIHHWLDGITRTAAILAGYALLVLSLGICAEIMLRGLFSYSMQGVDEIGGYVLAGASAFGFAYTLLHRGHTRIDMFLVRAPGWLQVVLNLSSAALMLGISGIMAWRAFATLSRSYSYGSLAPTPLQTPTWIPQAIWFSGFLLFAIVAGFMLIRAIAAIRNGPDEVNAIVGPVTLDETLDTEAEGRRTDTGPTP